MTAVQMPQCMNALELANRVRISNAELCKEIASLTLRDGCDRVASLLESGEPLALPVGRLVLSIRRIGESQLVRLLKHAGIFNPSKRVRDLTPRQRKALAFALRNRWMIA